MADKLALIRRDKALRSGQRVSVNVYTTLVSSTPKLMLNVMSDDYAEVMERRCACPLGALGYHTHFHTIRSHEELTSEGMTFLGHDLIRLVEEVLPGRFGGGPTDYQFVEVERDGLPRVDLPVSPRLGPARRPGRGSRPVRFPRPHPRSADRLRRSVAPGRHADRPSLGATLPAASKVLALHVAKLRSSK